MGIIATRDDGILLLAVRELAEYLKEDPIATAINVGNSFYLVAEEWEKILPTTPEEITAFYRQCRAYLWNLVFSNYGIGHQAMLRRSVHCLVKPKDRVLDLGAGIGSTLLHLASSRACCTHADVGGVLFDYARWRYERSGLLAGANAYQMVEMGPSYLGRASDPLAYRLFDVVVCTEVVEHVPEPEKLVEYIAGHLRIGGKLVCSVSFDDDHGLFPCHLNTDKYDNEKFITEVFPRYGLRMDGPSIFTRVAFEPESSK